MDICGSLYSLTSLTLTHSLAHCVADLGLRVAKSWIVDVSFFSFLYSIDFMVLVCFN